MDLQTILNDNELSKLLKHSVESTYNKYKLYYTLELEEFYQEVYVGLIKRLKSFNENLATIRTYLPLCVMSIAKNVLEKATGKSKVINKAFVESNMISLDNPYSESQTGDENLNFSEMIELDFNLENEVMKNMLIEEIINLDTLTDKQRTILQLMLKGYSGKEISEKMKCSQNCVSQNLIRAKEKILLKIKPLSVY